MNVQPSVTLPGPPLGLRIFVLADNTAQPGFQAEHGLSLALELPDGGLWLWDTGQTGLFLTQARRLGLDLTRARGVALSHGHYDHTGGLEHLLRLPGFRGEVVAHPASHPTLSAGASTWPAPSDALPPGPAFSGRLGW
jgi:7,8-dihydropterin-6-yl-methyl-4-(beta-D-ribofuranosyl)aminobenzene 5'-phosphate synthase